MNDESDFVRKMIFVRINDGTVVFIVIRLADQQQDIVSMDLKPFGDILRRRNWPEHSRALKDSDAMILFQIIVKRLGFKGLGFKFPRLGHPAIQHGGRQCFLRPDDRCIGGQS